MSSSWSEYSDSDSEIEIKKDERSDQKGWKATFTLKGHDTSSSGSSWNVTECTLCFHQGGKLTGTSTYSNGRKYNLSGTWYFIENREVSVEWVLDYGGSKYNYSGAAVAKSSRLSPGDKIKGTW